MKKILALLLAICGFSAFSLPLVSIYEGVWESTEVYHITPIPGTALSYGPILQFNNQSYIANGNSQPILGTNPSADPAYDALSAESLPAALTNTHILVGNSSNVPADVAMTGAITITNAGVTSATVSSFFVLPSTGNINNILTGGQTRVITATAGILAANGVESVPVTFGTAFSTGIYSIVASIVESTTAVPVVVKVLSSSTTGAVIGVYNLSGTTAMSGTGTIEVVATGH